MARQSPVNMDKWELEEAIELAEANKRQAERDSRANPIGSYERVSARRKIKYYERRANQLRDIYRKRGWGVAQAAMNI